MTQAMDEAKNSLPQAVANTVEADAKQQLAATDVDLTRYRDPLLSADETGGHVMVRFDGNEGSDGLPVVMLHYTLAGDEAEFRLDRIEYVAAGN